MRSEIQRARTPEPLVRARGATMAGSLAFLFVALLAVVSPAFAGPPSHPAVTARSIDGFNHACGVAVDSEGDIYVSSAGESKVRIFDPSHIELASIPNSNEPCGLAVDGNGSLYVTERLTGNVVKYVPNAYPIVGTPSYGAAITVDSSGEAKGISVDPVDGRLYVAKGSRIDRYNPDGSLGIDEVQRVLCFDATGGNYRLSFEGQKTGPIPCITTASIVKEALESLSTIGTGNVSVAQDGEEHLVTFVGKHAHADVDLLDGDPSELTGPALDKAVITSEQTKGFSGRIGKGDLIDATGVAAYTYAGGDRYVFAADAAGDQVDVFSGPEFGAPVLRREILGPKDGEAFDFGPAEAYLAVDPGNKAVDGTCAQIAEQACTAGHLLVYDAGHNMVNEFEANGEFLDQFSSPELDDAQPTALAVDRSGGAGDGTIYVSAGTGSGARVLAFGPLAAPSRSPLPGLSRALTTAQAVATDSNGNVYVAAGSAVHVYGPSGAEVAVGPEGKGIPTSEPAVDLAVDSACRIYVLVNRNSGNRAMEKVRYYTPDSCPPQNGTQYSGPTTVATGNSLPGAESPLQAIGINPKTDHVFVAGLNGKTLELGSAAEGSPILNSCFACALLGGAIDIAVYGADGNVYVSGNGSGTLLIVDSTGSEVIARINGAGSRGGQFGGSPGQIAVDQSNGHVLTFNSSRGTAEEYDASGAFVADFGEFTSISRPSGIAVDNSNGSTSHNVYVAFDDTKANTPDLWAFGPLAYGEQPLALIGDADGFGAGGVTLHGSVNPRGFSVTGCKFEYIDETQYVANGKTFAGAAFIPCAETPAALGKGTAAVPVHAEVATIDSDTRYRVRLIAENQYGAGVSAGLFGPPLLTGESSLSAYDEATLRAEIDPSGLPTKYHFEYGTSESYGQNTREAELGPGDGYVTVQALLTGLGEGLEYHFRLVAKNNARSVLGADHTFKTLRRPQNPSCANSEYRTGLSANLPDCRAYELVTPAETRGSVPMADGPGTAGQEFNNWLVAPRGPGSGETVGYFSTTLPGFNGTGVTDAYRAHRGLGEGPHPQQGWTTELVGPTYAQVGGGNAQQHGVASDQHYWFLDIGGIGEVLEETLDAGQYLRTPLGFELVGQGSLGFDPGAEGRFVSAGGGHVIFFSKEHLEPEAPPAGTVAIYDRAAGDSSGEVVSLLPSNVIPAAGQNATYVAAAEDGSTIVFQLGGTLYAHRAGKTVEVAPAPNAFAGISEDGRRVFYAAGSGASPATLYACDVEVGSCGEPPGRVEIRQSSIFVNVSPDGSAALLTSETAFAGVGPNENGETAEANKDNLYAWDGAEIRFVGILDPRDFESFDGYTPMNLLRWTRAVSAGVDIGRDNSPTRSTPGGEVFVFQSHARLTAYDNEGHGEIYRYELAATAGEQLVCVSCDPAATPPSGDALLQINSFGGVTTPTTLISNVTDDGKAVFFQSPDRLLPEDANDVQDVYEWKAQGSGNCEFSDGCLALISSGQGEKPSYLFGMTADGHDVFFETPQKLVSADVPGSASIYDARVDGGIPDRPTKAPCQGDACQGQGSTPPILPTPSSSNPGDGNVRKPPRRCPKGKHRVKGRCVAKHHKRKRHHSKRSPRQAQNERSGR